MQAGDTMQIRRNPNEDIRIKFTFSALQVYFELADEYESVAHAGVLFAAFAQHIDLYRVLDQRDALRDCLDASIENKSLIEGIIEGVRNFDWATFNPTGWIGQKIKVCLQDKEC